AGGRFDVVVRSLAELTTVFPRLVLALALGAVMGPGVVTAVVAFTLAAWPMAALPTRAQTLALRREEFVHAAEALGGSRGHILRRHILPGLWSGWLARAGGLMAQAVLLEAALGVLGLGAQEPQSSWGGMIRDGTPMLGQAPAMALSAATAVFVVSLAANLTADAVARSLDARRGGGIA
ncbi:MAG TPA: ABC transporter permease, partial [Azospirillaceae bacterium]|nr:ABC transporter permease [Azospirillaceae bacterium]